MSSVRNLRLLKYLLAAAFLNAIWSLAFLMPSRGAWWWGFVMSAFLIINVYLIVHTASKMGSAATPLEQIQARYADFVFSLRHVETWMAVSDPKGARWTRDPTIERSKLAIALLGFIGIPTLLYLSLGTYLIVRLPIVFVIVMYAFAVAYWFPCVFVIVIHVIKGIRLRALKR